MINLLSASDAHSQTREFENDIIAATSREFTSDIEIQIRSAIRNGRCSVRMSVPEKLINQPQLTQIIYELKKIGYVVIPVKYIAHQDLVIEWKEAEK